VLLSMAGIHTMAEMSSAGATVNVIVYALL
jgi:hypothetical protein